MLGTICQNGRASLRALPVWMEVRRTTWDWPARLLSCVNGRVLKGSGLVQFALQVMYSKGS